MKILVVPTIREGHLNRFLAVWETLGDWDKVIVVEDNPKKTFNIIGKAYHYCWEDVEKYLGQNAWIISKRDSAIRSFGFLIAYWMEADYILTLDDDCYPQPNSKPIFQAHIDAMNNHRRWTESVPGMRTRGLPYENQGKLENVVANMGLWSKIADYDAIQTLGTKIDEDFKPPTGSRIIPNGQYFPLCGMNFCFKRQATPLAYFPLMGENSPYRRFDDIWFGIIFKKIIDCLGWHVSVGDPSIEHQRASDPFVNLVKEAPGIALNEKFWRWVDSCQFNSSNTTGCMNDLGAHLSTKSDQYVAALGKALQVWVKVLDRNPFREQ